jgi:hypothetical protein
MKRVYGKPERFANFIRYLGNLRMSKLKLGYSSFFQTARGPIKFNYRELPPGSPYTLRKDHWTYNRRGKVVPVRKMERALEISHIEAPKEFAGRVEVPMAEGILCAFYRYDYTHLLLRDIDPLYHNSIRKLGFRLEGQDGYQYVLSKRKEEDYASI